MFTTPIDPPLKPPYRAAEKALFFAAFDRLESVGEAPTCQGWVRPALQSKSTV